LVCKSDASPNLLRIPMVLFISCSTGQMKRMEFIDLGFN
jgi:hypothetical protein